MAYVVYVNCPGGGYNYPAYANTAKAAVALMREHATDTQCWPKGVASVPVPTPAQVRKLAKGQTMPIAYTVKGTKQQPGFTCMWYVLAV